MKQSELRSYIVQIRSKLYDGSYSPEDAFAKIWGNSNGLTYEQREEAHRALNLPFEVPTPLDILSVEGIQA